jgi:branched-chain amino acid transport system permease protein
MISAYIIHLVILISIYLILSLAMQITIGWTGLLNLGHIAFYAIGAYGTALLSLIGFPFWLIFLIAGILGALSGWLLTIPTHKLKGDYLALASVGFVFVIYALTLNWTDLTRGPLGIPGIPRPEIFGFLFSDNISFLFLSLLIAILSFLFVKKITSSLFGKVLESIRDDELASKTLGKNTLKVKSLSMAISGFLTGIAGSLYAYYITFIDPSSFSLMQIIPILSIVIIGGLASLKGTFIATIILMLLPEIFRFVGFPSTIIGPARQILYALALLLILIYKPKGFFGKVELE